MVIRGAEYRDSVLQDLTDMTTALDESQRDAATTEMEPLQNAQGIIARLNSEIGALLDGSVATDINQRIVTIYADIAQVKQIQKDLAANEVAQLQETAVAQGRITSDVITQTVILGLVVFLIALTASVVINRTLRPIGDLTETATAIAGGDLNRTAPIQSQDEIGQLARSFNIMTLRLRDTIDSLETRVAARTDQLRASADVGRTAASVLDPDELLNRVVNLITERFGFYYAAVFTKDNQNRYAILREATGEAGRVLKAQGHQLEIGGRSMVGQAMARRQPRIALDIGEEAVRFANPLLPDTRSEIALPLVAGEQVLGALDVQSTAEAAFDESSAAVLQSMADQIAVALSNAEQFKQANAALQRAENLSESILTMVDAKSIQEVVQLLAHHANSMVAANRTTVYLVDHDLKQVLAQAVAGDNYDPETLKYEDLNSGISGLVFRSGQPVLSLSADDGIEPAETAERRRQNGTGALIVAPLVAQGRVIGTVTASNLISQRLFTHQDVDLFMTLAAQSVSVIERLRLFEQAQRALSDLDTINRQLTGAGWEKFARRRSQSNYIWVTRSDQLQPSGEVGPSGGEKAALEVGPSGAVGPQPLSEVTEALALGHIATRLLDDGEQLGVAVPIKLRDVPIGTLRMIVPLHSWTSELSTSLESIAGHVAQAAENARLITESEERLARERALTEATEKVRQRNDIDSILETAAAELARYLNANRIAVRLTAPGEKAVLGEKAALDDRAAGNGHAA